MSNQYRFRILELVQTNQKSISALSSELNLSYTKCADYVRLLEKVYLIRKIKKGKETMIASKATFSADTIKF